MDRKKSFHIHSPIFMVGGRAVATAARAAASSKYEVARSRPAILIVDCGKCCCLSDPIVLSPLVSYLGRSLGLGAPPSRHGGENFGSLR